MRMKTGLRSVVGALCAAVILLSGVFTSYGDFHTAALTLEDINSDAVTVTFDNMPEYYRVNSSTTVVTAYDGSFTVEEGKGFDGTSALKRKLTNTKDGDNKYQALNDGDDPLKVVTDTVYMVRFKYYVEVPSDVLTVDIRSALNGNFFYNSNTLVSEQFHVSYAGEWKTKTMFFTTPSSFKTDKKGELCNSLFIGVQGKGNSVIYIDNVEVTALWKKDANYSAVYADTGFDSDSKIIIGNVGDKITVDIPQHNGEQFLNWCSDEALSKETEAPTKIEKEITHIYAEYYGGTRIVTFDDIPSELVTNSDTTLVTAAGYYVSENLGEDGSAVLKRQKPADPHSREQALNDGSGYFLLKSNTTYRVRLEYFVAAGSGQTYLNFATARAGNMYYNRKYWINGLALNVKNGEWFTSETVFTTDNIGIDNCAYIGVSGDVNTTVYLDNIQITELAPDDIVLEYRASQLGLTKYVIGKANTEITDAPDMSNKNYDFGGWFTDASFDNPFENRLFPNESMVIYGKVKWKDVLTVGFDDYPFAGTTEITGQFSGTVYEIANDNSSDGDGYSLKFDNSRAGQSRYEVPFLLNIGEEAMLVEDNTKYLITFDYYFENATNSEFHFEFATSDPKNRWNKFVKFTNMFLGTDGNYEHKTWLTASCFGTTQVKDGMNALVAYVQIPRSAILYIDNIRIRKISDDEAVLVYYSDCSNAPEPIVAKKKTTLDVADFGTYIPNGKSFVGLYNGEEIYGNNTVTLEDDVVLNAKTVTVSADEGFEKTSYLLRGLTGFGYDYDFEIYDSVKSGNASNVKSGRYSLHRIGAEPTFKSYSLHGNGYMSMYILNEFKKYTITYNVKIENAAHDKGAIGIRSLTSSCDPWTFTGYELYTAAIADVADGNWHTVSFTFVATSPYLAFITPGNLSIYIDDINIVSADDSVEISQSVEYDEYVPKLSTADKKTNTEEELGEFTLVYPEKSFIRDENDYIQDEYTESTDEKNDSSIEKADKTVIINKKNDISNEESGFKLWICIVLPIFAVVLIATFVIIALRKRKGTEEKS